jgi:hypothetical protein
VPQTCEDRNDQWNARIDHAFADDGFDRSAYDNVAAFRNNALTLSVSAASTVFHELVVLWDVASASTRRPPNVTEQHLHGFLEVLPILTFSFLLCLRPNQAASVFGLGPERPDFTIRPKAEPPSPAYVAALLLLVTTSIGLPYAEELVRCLRANPSPLPRPKRPQTGQPRG